jgi:hypothetical protein
MEASLEKERLHRFVRRPLKTKFYPNDRDEAVLVDLFYAGYRTTAQLQTLFGRWIDEKLTLMFKAGYIDRPEAQWVWRRQKGGGSKPLVHALSQQGYDHIHNLKLVPATNRDFSERNRDLSEFSSHIPHELAIGDVEVAFHHGCAKRTLQLMHIQELARGQNARALIVPGDERKLYPDWLFAISKGESEPSLFFTEINMGTEPNGRHAASELQHLEYKYAAYLSYAHSKRCLEQFGVSNFRVLTITRGGEQKLENVARAAGNVCGGVGVGRFLATNFATLLSGDPFELPWINAVGEETRLL